MLQRCLTAKLQKMFCGGQEHLHFHLREAEKIMTEFSLLVWTVPLIPWINITKAVLTCMFPRREHTCSQVKTVHGDAPRLIRPFEAVSDLAPAPWDGNWESCGGGDVGTRGEESVQGWWTMNMTEGGWLRNKWSLSTNGSSGEGRLLGMMNLRRKSNEEENGVPGDRW